MKLYHSEPKPEVRLVKRPDTENEYEVWLVEPTRVGSLVKHARNKIGIEGNSSPEFSTLMDAVHYMLQLSGHAKMLDFAEAPTRVTMKGTDLMLQNLWPQFCKIRRIDPKALPMLEREYHLSPAEQAELGIKR